MSVYIVIHNDELYHYGVKGMKWGVRRYQNEDGTLTKAGIKRRDNTINKINSLYDHSNKWTGKKIERLKRRNKHAKVAIMEEMIRQNEQARTKHTSNVNKSNAVQYKKMRSEDINDYMWGGQDYMDRNASHMTVALNRLKEYNIQRGMRWYSNVTMESTLARMSPSEGYRYLDNKTRAGRNVSVGMNSVPR